MATLHGGGHHLPEEDDCLSAPLARLASVLGGAIVLIALARALFLFEKLGLVLMTQQILALILGLALVIVFVSKPARFGGPRLRLPWYDVIAALMAFAACLYVAIDYITIVRTIFSIPLPSLIAGTVIVLASAECLRRTAGTLLFVFVVAFIAFGLFGYLVPGALQGREVAPERLLSYLGLDNNGILGMPIEVVVTIVIAFIFFGNLLNASGGGNFFTEIATATMGGYRGGSAKIAVVASSLFGTISGSAVANVASVGVVTIPMMRRGGYPPEKAAAIEAVASTGGQIMPPMMGAAAFLMAEFLRVPYTEIIKAALIPAFLYYASLFIQADLYAAREGIRPIEERNFRALEVLGKGWPFVFPFAVILIGLFNFGLQAQTAALYATVALLPLALFVGYRGQRMHWRRIFAALGETGIAITQLLMVSAMAGIVIGVLNITGLGFALTEAVVQLSGGHLWIILILAAVISIVLGMGMPTVGVYLLLATLVVPSMVEAGIQPIAAHMFAFYFGILSMITPPVAAAAFAAATVGKTSFLRTGVEAVRFGWPAYVVPFIFVLSPEMLWQGSAFGIARIAVLSLAGVWLISAGWIGYFAGLMSGLWRLGFVAAGVLCLLPGESMPHGSFIDISGIVLAVVLVLVRLSLGKTKVQNATAS